jgi:RNA polymerase sigma factor (sigma-70 family)
MRSLISLDADPALANTIPDEEKDPLKDLTNSEVKEKVCQTIARMSPQNRLFLLLRFYEGMTYPEIAHVMGVSTDHIRKYRSKVAEEEFRKKFPKALLNEIGLE